MRYDFNEQINRRGTNSVKWDLADEDVLPMWVADMDFRVAPCITDALLRRVENGVFGYVTVPNHYYNSIVKWFWRRHNWKMEPEWIIYTSGVIPALSAIIKAMTNPDDKVLVQTPVYNHFFSSIRNNGCRANCSPLKEVIGEDGIPTYEVNWEDFEERAADPATKVFVLCNPHNPAGRVWKEDELRRMGDICLKHNVFVISDEIHCEIVLPEYKYIPYASLGEEYQKNCAVCTSPSKAFNIAGLHIANITIEDEEIRKRVDKAININEVCDVPVFGVEALIAAYNEGGDWLNQLCEHIGGTYRFVQNYFKENMPQLPVTKLEGTYLMWVNCKATGLTGKEFCEQLLEKERLWFNEGDIYGAAGQDYFRINIACPRPQIYEALTRLKHFVDSL